MMYGSETWTLYRHHIKLIRTIQQRHLRSILKIRWDHFITNDEALEQIALDGSRCTYSRCVAREALLYGVLEEDSREGGRPLLSYKDILKDILKRGAALGTWREIVTDRLAWRRLTSERKGPRTDNPWMTFFIGRKTFYALSGI